MNKPKVCADKLNLFSVLFFSTTPRPLGRQGLLDPNLPLPTWAQWCQPQGPGVIRNPGRP